MATKFSSRERDRDGDRLRTQTQTGRDRQRETERKNKRKKERKKERKTDRQTDRQTDRKRQTETERHISPEIHWMEESLDRRRKSIDQNILIIPIFLENTLDAGNMFSKQYVSFRSCFLVWFGILMIWHSDLKQIACCRSLPTIWINIF